MPFARGSPKPPGSGRKKGGKNKMARDVRELAQMHTPAAIAVLAQVMNDDQSPPAARVMAANALLDRGHGKAQQALTEPDAPGRVVNIEIVRQQIRARLERIAAAHEEATTGRLIDLKPGA
jgi:hypothetical protein